MWSQYHILVHNNVYHNIVSITITLLYTESKSNMEQAKVGFFANGISTKQSGFGIALFLGDLNINI